MVYTNILSTRAGLAVFINKTFDNWIVEDWGTVFSKFNIIGILHCWLQFSELIIHQEFLCRNFYRGSFLVLVCWSLYPVNLLEFLSHVSRDFCSTPLDDAYIPSTCFIVPEYGSILRLHSLRNRRCSLLPLALVLLHRYATLSIFFIRRFQQKSRRNQQSVLHWGCDRGAEAERGWMQKFSVYLYPL